MQAIPFVLIDVTNDEHAATIGNASCMRNVEGSSTELVQVPPAHHQSANC
jgi:hypothetical protein